jgi:hypothetical protein
MARKSAAKKEDPVSDDGSAQSDVEMQDQQDDKMSGFKKFGVSATLPCAFLHRHPGVDWEEGAVIVDTQANVAGTV